MTPDCQGNKKPAGHHAHASSAMTVHKQKRGKPRSRAAWHDGGKSTAENRRGQIAAARKDRQGKEGGLPAGVFFLHLISGMGVV